MFYQPIPINLAFDGEFALPLVVSVIYEKYFGHLCIPENLTDLQAF